MNSNARQGRQSVFSAAGARPEGQELLLDDESIVNYWKRGLGTITGSSLGMEAMAEFQALTNTYSAQFGGNGAVINAVSKSGTNSFHGSAYEFIRNSAMDGRGFFDPGVIPFRRNQPGGSLGGPVKKDKAFFFVNYEGVWQLLAQTKIATVPDAAHRTPTFARASNPVSYDGIVNALALYPMPAFNFNPAAGTGQVTQVANQVAHEHYFLGRFDYTLSAKDSFFTRYFFDKQHVVDPFGGGYAGVGLSQVGLPLWPETNDSMNHFATIEWRRIISPTLLNTARVSFSRPNTAELATDFHPALQMFPGIGRADAAVAITGISPLGQVIFAPPYRSKTGLRKPTTWCGRMERIPPDSAPPLSGINPIALPPSGPTQIGSMEAWRRSWRPARTRAMRPPRSEERPGDRNTTSTGISAKSTCCRTSRTTGRRRPSSL